MSEEVCIGERNSSPDVRMRQGRRRCLGKWLNSRIVKVKESSEEFCRLVKESVIKELDYQFRLQEERQEERDRLQVKRSEEYYRRMDALLREKSGRDAKKAFPFGNAFLSKMKETR